MAISSYNVVLKTSDTATGTYTELVPVKDFPDLGSAPDTIEVTTLRDKMKRYIQGLQDTGSFEFTYNYTKADFTKVKALDDNEKHFFELDFGNDGTGGEGSFYFYWHWRSCGSQDYRHLRFRGQDRETNCLINSKALSCGAWGFPLAPCLAPFTGRGGSANL